MRLAITQQVNFKRYPAAQLLDGIVGAVLLDETQDSTGDDDGEDNTGIYPFPGDNRDNGCKYKDEHERAFELAP